MKEIGIKFLLSVASFSGILFFLFVGKSVDIPFVGADWVGKNNLLNIFVYLKHLEMLCIVLGLSYLGLSFVRNYMPPISGSDTITEIKPIEGSFLPVYIGLFVIALSFSDSLQPETITLLLVLFVFWTFLDGVSYFNPFWLLFGYRFYEAKSKTGSIFTLISKKKDVKITNGTYVLDKLIRINNFTFLQK